MIAHNKMVGSWLSISVSFPYNLELNRGGLLVKLVFGGRTRNMLKWRRLKDLQCYDTENQVWIDNIKALKYTEGSGKGVTPGGLYRHAMVHCSNSILIFGGISKDQQACNDVWLLDLSSFYLVLSYSQPFNQSIP